MSHQADSKCTTGVQEPPQALLDLVVTGKACLANGDLKMALVNFEKVVMEFPDHPEGHNNLGALYTSLCEFDKAEACFNRVLEFLPDNPNINYNRGIVRIRLHKLDTAEDDFNIVLAANPEDADAINNLGVIAYLKGQIGTAERQFNKALELRPDFPNAVLNMCDLLVTRNQAMTAVAMCEQHLGEYTNLDVQVKLFELLSEHSLATLKRAGSVAEDLMEATDDSPEVRALLSRVLKAQKALEEPKLNEASAKA